MIVFIDSRCLTVFWSQTPCPLHQCSQVFGFWPQLTPDAGRDGWAAAEAVPGAKDVSEVSSDILGLYMVYIWLHYLYIYGI